MANLLVVLSLGIAGIDPVGMMLLIAAMTKGFTKRQSITYALLVFLGTAATGTLLSAVFGARLTSLISRLLSNFIALPDAVWVLIYVLVILLLVTWAVKRVLHKEKADTEKAKKGVGKGVYGMAAFMVFTAIVDPSFLAVLALSSRHCFLLAFFYNSLWVLLSQLPLALLTVAVLFNQHQSFIEKYNYFYDRYQAKISLAITSFIFLVAAGFLLDLVSYLSTGIWLFE